MDDFEDPWDYFEEDEDIFSQDTRTKARLQQERMLASERNRVIDSAIDRIENIITTSEVTIANIKAVPNPNDPTTNVKGVKIVNIQELEQALTRTMKTWPELGVKFYWGLHNPLHSFKGPERVLTRDVFREMIPKTRVEMLRKKNLNKWGCECGGRWCRLYG